MDPDTAEQKGKVSYELTNVFLALPVPAPEVSPFDFRVVQEGHLADSGEDNVFRDFGRDAPEGTREEDARLPHAVLCFDSPQTQLTIVQRRFIFGDAGSVSRR